MISVPNNHKDNICNSNNYSSICLCSCINKLLEWCMIHRYGDKLYYRNGRSKVYACFMDGSKAFDRIRHDKLFKILQDRGIHPLVLRLIIDMYKRQIVERHAIM